MKFLVIDDDFDSRRLVQKILHPYGYVEVAADGEEGVEAFRAALKDGEPYDVITLDIMMPNMDGQDALREIREVEKEMGIAGDKATKVIMISGLDDNKEVHDAFFLGDAISYIVKPIRKQTLLDEIQSLGVTLEKSAE
ncbi:response regulator [Desulfovibrio subterraneus]|jgi:two-component system chemotaxis response regulator CheY|uniref:Two-component system response regulator n=1 Tax=Desulfovibrio subterraneus TaxID=2718620 RepID=A0A7J0BJ65_9BACT|nr:response regulator [Desulfovibrio subterraneus]WBF67892.1 response regulator [Desulfovibrio subterraneus]GFM33757.1 two-component system response regulator [Desulfovibrio subterraneus]